MGICIYLSKLKKIIYQVNFVKYVRGHFRGEKSGIGIGKMLFIAVENVKKTN